ncbi:hypothetical protein HMPREF0083_05978 [Aneurinibacillus aneurinilyticus ATCC 12856]|uniref:Uncharacterized protein n=1 Tax=Aneurinibacillus aneurinilyticus ATCC 12856 TaxID=649747 RepID=U1XXE6_ANEAE|nr:hypothetical protein HMPREF0083_05978 [Aneurinibacillus aneurinilyticus ATCC 12856]
MEINHTHLLIIHKEEEGTRVGVFPRLFPAMKSHGRFVAQRPDQQNIWVSRCGRQLLVIFVLCATRSTQEKQRGRTPYARLFSIHLWIPRVLIFQRVRNKLYMLFCGRRTRRPFGIRCVAIHSE